MAKSKRHATKNSNNQPSPTVELSSDNISNENLISSLKIRKLNVQFRNESQSNFWKTIDTNEITLCAGPAGTGKTFLSIAKALDMLSQVELKFKRIILIKPVVEAHESLGFLPGDMQEKLEPYVYSYMYIFEKLLGKRKLDKLIERGYIQVMALAYLRGVNIDDSIVIADEMQNCTKLQAKTLLTRIGENSKYILCGDFQQSDRYKNHKDSGLYFAIDKLKNLENIGIFEFKEADIVRNPLITHILERFNGDAEH